MSELFESNLPFSSSTDVLVGLCDLLLIDFMELIHLVGVGSGGIGFPVFSDIPSVLVLIILSRLVAFSSQALEQLRFLV